MPRRCSTTSLTDLFRAVLSTMLYWAKRLFEIIISLFICKFYLIRFLKREIQNKGTDLFEEKRKIRYFNAHFYFFSSSILCPVHTSMIAGMVKKHNTSAFVI